MKLRMIVRVIYAIHAIGKVKTEKNNLQASRGFDLDK